MKAGISYLEKLYQYEACNKGKANYAIYLVFEKLNYNTYEIFRPLDKSA